MIEYEVGRWGLLFAFRMAGSVFPKASIWAAPSALLAIVFSIYMPNTFDFTGSDYVWASYNFLVGALMVFRTNQAYARFWEGTSLVCQIRGEWINAVSNLMAFCSRRPEIRQQVREYQHVLVRLMSMLHCAALQQVASMQDDRFDVIDPKGLQMEHLNFVASIPPSDRCEIILSWIQRLTVQAHQAGQLEVPPPILSRAFQELSQGIVNHHSARKIREHPFPFPYAQMLTAMMLAHWIFCPIIASQTMDDPLWVGAFTFTTVFCFWAVYYIGAEIEQPFGDDANDLPLAAIQKEFNRTLLSLLRKETQTPPRFNLFQANLGTTAADFSKREDTPRNRTVRYSTCSMATVVTHVSERENEDRKSQYSSSQEVGQRAARASMSSGTYSAGLGSEAGMRSAGLSVRGSSGSTYGGTDGLGSEAQSEGAFSSHRYSSASTGPKVAKEMKEVRWEKSVECRTSFETDWSSRAVDTDSADIVNDLAALDGFDEDQAPTFAVAFNPGDRAGKGSMVFPRQMTPAAPGASGAFPVAL